MKKFIRRFLAYLIDMFVVYLLSSCLLQIPVIDKQLDKYNEAYREYEQKYTSYVEFYQELENSYGDSLITEKEYSNLVKKNEDYGKILDKYYDGKLSKSNYKKLLNEINSYYQNEYKDMYYEINKYSFINNGIYLLVLLGYFIGINIFMNGQTIGKKLLKIRIVNDSDCGKVAWYNYVIRSVILYNPLCSLALLVGPYFLDVEGFYNWALVWSNIKTWLELIIVVMIVIRTDNRGLHELLSKTKLLYLDDNRDYGKENEEQEDVVVIKEKVPRKRKKINKKIVIDSDN